VLEQAVYFMQHHSHYLALTIAQLAAVERAVLLEATVLKAKTLHSKV
jgi:hypothetical protein